jgi:glycosyltransferase involved in cell wall biosynthesis
MRILHSISSVNPAGGGPIETLKQLGRVAVLKGHTVEVVSLDDPAAPYLREFPVPVYPLGPGTSWYRFSRRLVPWLRENARRYDIIVVNGIWQYNSFGVWRALRKSSPPYVIFTHGMLDPWFKRAYPMKHLKKWLYWPWGEYRVLRDAAAVLFTCEEERRLARQSFWLYSANEKVVNYGTAMPLGDSAEQRREFFDRFPDLRDKRIVLVMGRIHPKKGCDIALQAFAAVLADEPGWHLVMAGPDQTGWKSSLEALAAKLGIASRITWTGQVGGNLKWGVVRSADVLFLPSHQENFGIVVAEAMSCGVPVLISDKVNIWREVLQDGGGFVQPDSLAGASELLSSWLNLSENGKRCMREFAQRSFEKRFEIKQASQTLLSVLDEFVSERNANSEYSNCTEIAKMPRL